jgi:hypothetical protein
VTADPLRAARGQLALDSDRLAGTGDGEVTVDAERIDGHASRLRPSASENVRYSHPAGLVVHPETDSQGRCLVEDMAVECEQLLCNMLGAPLFDELVQAMLDAAVPPADLSIAHWSVLVELRDHILDRLRAELAQYAEDERQALRSRMPWFLQEARIDLASAILEMGTRPRYFSIPKEVFDSPHPHSRFVARTLPKGSYR